MNVMTNPIPSHVPRELVQDFDIYFHGTYEYVFDHWKSLHEPGRPEIFWTPRNGGHWICTRADDVEEVYKNYENFTTVPYANAIPFREVPAPPLPIASDPPEHGEYRRLINSFFFPKRVAQVGEHARVLINEIMDRVIPQGGCEFYNDVSMDMPIHAFLGLAGLPGSYWSTLMPWARSLVRDPDPELAVSVTQEVWDFLKGCMADRKAHPGDDPLTALVEGDVFGRKMTENEYVGSALNFMLAGLDTTPATLSIVAHYLATQPEQRRRLVEDPSLIPLAVEELLRRFPAGVTGRMVKNDLTYKGVQLKAGDAILSPAILGNLDERRFPDPMTVDFHRKGLNQMLTFGAGPHRCVGSMLARMQIRVFMEEWLKRIPEFHVAEGEVPEMHCGIAMAMTYLPLRW